MASSSGPLVASAGEGLAHQLDAGSRPRSARRSAAARPGSRPRRITTAIRPCRSRMMVAGMVFGGMSKPSASLAGRVEQARVGDPAARRSALGLVPVVADVDAEEGRPRGLGGLVGRPPGRRPRPGRARTSEPQKLTTTTWPAWPARVVACRPSSRSPATSEAPSAGPAAHSTIPSVACRAGSRPLSPCSRPAPPRTTAASSRRSSLRRRTHQAPLAVRAVARQGDQVRGRLACSRCRPPSRRRSGTRSGWPARTGAGAGRARAACARRSGAASRSAAGARRRPPRAPRPATRAACTRGEHPLGDRPVGLAPGRGRTGRAAPTSCAGRGTRRRRRRHLLALEAVGALDQPLVDADRQPELGGDRLGGLLGALQRAGHHVRDVAVGERLRGRLGHLLAQLGEAEAGQPAVEDLGRGCAPRRAAARARPSCVSRHRPARRCRRAAPRVRQRRRRCAPARRRRSRPTRTTPRTRSAAGRRRRRASRGRTP